MLLGYVEKDGKGYYIDDTVKEQKLFNIYEQK